MTRVVRLEEGRRNLYSKRPQGKAPNGLLFRIQNFATDKRFTHVKVFADGGLMAVDGRGTILMVDFEGNGWRVVYRVGKRVTGLTCGKVGNGNDLYSSLKEVFVSTEGNCLYAINLQRKKIIAELKGENPGATNSVEYRLVPKQEVKYVLSCCSQKLNVFETSKFEKIKVLQSKSDGLRFAKFSKCGKFLLSLLLNEIILWKCDDLSFSFVNKCVVPPFKNTPKDEELVKFDVSSFDVSSKGTFLVAVCEKQGYMFLWDFERCKIIRIFDCTRTTSDGDELRKTLFDDFCGIKKVMFWNTTENKVFILSNEGILYIVELSTGRVLYTVSFVDNLDSKVLNTRSKIIDFAISYNDSWLVVNFENGELQYYSLKNLHYFKMSKSGSKQMDSLKLIFQKLKIVKDYDVSKFCFDGFEVEKTRKREKKGKKVVKMRQTKDLFKRSTSKKFPPKVNFGMRKWTPSFNLTCSKRKSYIYAHRKKKGIELNFEKLKSLLLEFGEYPEKYRKKVWKYILCLPNNKEGFSALQKKGDHFSSCLLDKEFSQMKKTRAGSLMLEKLKKAMSTMCNLSAVFTVDVFVDLVYPVLKSFPKNLLFVFEVVLTFVNNWGKDLLMSYPKPSSSVIQIVRGLLKVHDPDVVAHFDAFGIAPEVYSWNLMKSMFTDVLCKADWYKLFDHVFSMPPSYLFYFVVSFVMYHRETLLFVEKRKGFETFFQRSTPISINKAIKFAYHLQKRSKLKKWKGLSLATLQKVHSLLKKYKTFSQLPSKDYRLLFKYPENAIEMYVEQKRKIAQNLENMEFLEKKYIPRLKKEEFIERREEEEESEQKVKEMIIQENEVLEKKIDVVHQKLVEEKLEVYDSKRKVKNSNEVLMYKTQFMNAVELKKSQSEMDEKIKLGDLEIRRLKQQSKLNALEVNAVKVQKEIEEIKKRCRMAEGKKERETMEMKSQMESELEVKDFEIGELRKRLEMKKQKLRKLKEMQQGLSPPRIIVEKEEDRYVEDGGDIYVIEKRKGKEVDSAEEIIMGKYRKFLKKRKKEKDKLQEKINALGDERDDDLSPIGSQNSSSSSIGSTFSDKAEELSDVSSDFGSDDEFVRTSKKPRTGEKKNDTRLEDISTEDVSIGSVDIDVEANSRDFIFDDEEDQISQFDGDQISVEYASSDEVGNDNPTIIIHEKEMRK